MNPHIIQGHDDSRDESRLARLGRVVRAPFARTTIIGSALVALGLIGTTMVGLYDGPVSVATNTTQRVSTDCIIVGALLLVYVSLRRRGRSIEEAYRLGYDLGFENGYRAGREARDPVPVPLHPAVDDLAVGDVVSIRTRRGPAG